MTLQYQLALHFQIGSSKVMLLIRSSIYKKTLVLHHNYFTRKTREAKDASKDSGAALDARINVNISNIQI